MVGRSRVVRLDGLKVGSVMAATLTGSAGLAISPAGEQHRNLGGADNAMWEWRVSAVAAGPQELRLRVATLALDARGAPTTLELKPRRFAVAVAVRPASAGERLGALPGQVERAANDWTDALKALGGLFVAAGATWGAWRALRRPGGAKATA